LEAYREQNEAKAAETRDKIEKLKTQKLEYFKREALRDDKE
jgi:hypothetical protein